jgi:hypothetical protein
MINVTIGKSKTQEKPFPKLMKQLDTGWVMLFLDEKTCIHIEGIYKGELVENYSIDGQTVDFNEPITLQNA